jgi:hypothetical protein
VRAEVTYALGQRRPDSAEVIDVLIEALSDPSAMVRAGAAGALGEIGAPAARAAPEIVKLATGGDTWTRTAALGAIEQMGTSGRTVGEARVLWAKAVFSSAVGTVQSGHYRISNQMPSAGGAYSCDTMMTLLVSP